MLNLDCRGDRVPLSRVALLGICLLLAAALPMAAPRGEHTQRTVPGKVGTKAPRFAATLLDGRSVDSNDLLGKVVVLKFWYVACGPCRAEIPHLNKLVDEFAGQPVVFLGFALDAPEKLRLFLEEMPYRYQVVPNAEPVASTFGVAGRYPTHVVIDRQGTITYFGAGGSPATADTLRPLIKTALLDTTVARIGGIHGATNSRETDWSAR